MDDLIYNLVPLRGPGGCARAPAMMPPRRLLAGDTRGVSAELAELLNRKRQQAERDDFDGAKVTHGEIQRLQAEMTDLQKKATQQRELAEQCEWMRRCGWMEQRVWMERREWVEQREWMWQSEWLEQSRGAARAGRPGTPGDVKRHEVLLRCSVRCSGSGARLAACRPSSESCGSRPSSYANSRRAGVVGA